MDEKNTGLVVEDDEDLRNMLACTLERSGFNVVVTTNGSEAMVALECNLVDVVLSDINMPVMDGVALTRHINTKFKDLPVILMTGRLKANTPELADLEVFKVIEKPFTPSVIMSLINQAIVASAA